MNDWHTRHFEVVSDFLHFLNNKTDTFVLKGGTALLVGYQLDRFSEDIDLDGTVSQLPELVDAFCKQNKYSYKIAINTPTVQRCFINYGIEGKPLKIEVSFRRREINVSETSVINGVRIYTIDSLCIMKSNAYTERDKIRDLYDLAFICNHYFDMLPLSVVSVVRDAVGHKGLEQFDYIVRTQADDLIDVSKLSEDFLNMVDKLGLLYTETERMHIENKKFNSISREDR
jgi:predicted nucleotidyltransferase